MIPEKEVPSSWPFQEAYKLWQRFPQGLPSKGYVLFETGYGPSGLPHIGTFGEVVRTSMVRHAFEQLTGWPTKLFCFSDDLDGLRKVPDNVPHPQDLKKDIGLPLTRARDPWGCCPSFGHHNNAQLRKFLDGCGFNYTFVSSTQQYQLGVFDKLLRKVLDKTQDILDIMLPSLRDERRNTYSPFLPLCPETGQVLQVPVTTYLPAEGCIIYTNTQDKSVKVPVTGGKCKLQWKVDWGMRWAALGVNYEMAGKDLIDSVKLSSKICCALGYDVPVTMIYELFLDAHAQKISKSKGNGLSVDEWLSYAPQDTLSYFMYHNPQRAKRLSFESIPQSVDAYFQELATASPHKRDDAVWHVHAGKPPQIVLDINFGMLLNLAGVCHTTDPVFLWNFLNRYYPGLSPKTHPEINHLIEGALAYYSDKIAPTKRYAIPMSEDQIALDDLKKNLRQNAHYFLPTEDSVKRQEAETQIMSVLYEVGKQNGYRHDLKAWFQRLYLLLLGKPQGPRLGPFMLLYGLDETLALIDEACQRKCS